MTLAATERGMRCCSRRIPFHRKQHFTSPCPWRAFASKCAPSNSESSSRTIFSGIQPTGIPHLGNYFGALSNWVHLQRTAKANDTLLFSVVGWHALTLPQDPERLKVARREMIAVLLSVGIDPAKSIVFHQDQNPAHAELAWILSCMTPLGKLKRMSAWKSRLAVSRNANDESEVDESLLNAGLFTYPILQAADILLYKSTHVPVGEDQKQHLELTRDLADAFNRSFKSSLFPSSLFPIPERLSNTAGRIRSLTSPTAKMSKSAHDPSSRILLTDNPSEVHKKIKKAVTDSVTGVSWDPIERPGVSNLITILSACERELNRVETDIKRDEAGDQEAECVAQRYISAGKGIKDLKSDVTDAIVETLRPSRETFESLRGEISYLDSVAKSGADMAQALAAVTIGEVRKRVGLD